MVYEEVAKRNKKMDTPTRIIGRIASFNYNGFYKFVATDGSPKPFDTLFLSSRQIGTAKIGNNVALEYRSTGNYGEWVVAEVLA
jgi:hypothetical protein